jgi:recombinational DNA repair ATPase RecF
LLIDDPAAELDAGSLERLLGVLRDLPAQLVLTGLSPRQLVPQDGFPVFHVERGEVRAL